MATWKKLIEEELNKNGESLLDIVAITLSDEKLNREFYDGFGSSQGDPFTAWTNRFVYFPVTYDGSEWVGSVPRNPCDKATQHQGGE